MDRKRREAIRAQRDDVEDRLNERGPGQPTGVRKTFKPRPLGNSRAAILRRLGREFPELHRLVLGGEVTPFAAAVAAGFRKRPGPRPKRPVDTTEDGYHEVLLELWLGPKGHDSLFETVDELRQAWLRHRDRVMALWGRNGRRPMGWWEFEAGDLEYPGYDDEPAFLFKHGLLSPEERIQFESDHAAPRAE